MAGLIQQGSLLLRHMEENPEDVRSFLRWMTDPATMRYWDGKTERYDYDRVVRRHREHLQAGVTPCMIVQDGESIGYLQFYPIACAEDNDLPPEMYGAFVRPGETVYGIDLFIGRTDLRSRGTGTAVVRMACDLLFGACGASHILVDPKIHNARAIRCYEKAGFRHWFTVPGREQQDGIFYDSFIMGRDREQK